MDEADRAQEIQERHAIEREHRRQIREQAEREAREEAEKKAEADRQAARQEMQQRTLARHQREREERARLRAEQERDQKEQRAKKEREVLERHRGERETRVALRHDQTVAHLRSRRESEAYRKKQLPAIREQWRVSPWEPRKTHSTRVGTALDRGLAVLDPFADTAYKAHDFLFQPRVQTVRKLNKRTGQFDISYQMGPSRYGSFRTGVLQGMDTFERGRRRETRAYRSQARMMRAQFASPTQFMYSLMGRKPRKRGYIREPWDDNYKPRKRRMSSRAVRDPWEFGFGF